MPPDPGNESAPLQQQRGAESAIEKPYMDDSTLLDKWRALGAACRDSRLSRTDVAVLFVIADRMNVKTGVSWPGLGTIASDARINRSSAVRAVRDLVQHEYLQRDSGSPGTSNRYRLGRCEYAPRRNPAPRGELAPGVGADLRPGVGADLRPEFDSLNLNNETDKEEATAIAATTTADPSSKKPKSRPRKSEKTFSQWISSLPDDQDAIPPGHSVFTYARKIGLPEDFLELAWWEFSERYERAPKKYKDWPEVFRRAVHENWLKLWAIGDNGDYYLTTVGQQAIRSQGSYMAKGGSPAASRPL